MEFGIFNDEGCCERGFTSKEEAERAIAERYEPGDELHAAEVCHDHPENERFTCEICNAEG
jgi:uncharacterized protein (UPF0128 family)